MDVSKLGLKEARVESSQSHPYLGVMPATQIGGECMEHNVAPESNSKLFVWALFLLDGASKHVDVEDIYLKCFEVAPKRFSWRTRPDLPDSKRASKALAEAEKHTDFILKINPYTRRLSAEGLAWIESQLPQLQKAFGEAEVPPPRTNQHMRLQRDLKSHAIWKSFEDGTESDLIHILADALRCSPASPHAVWGTRFSALEIAANHLQDPELLEFLKFAVAVYEDSKGGTN